MGTVVVLIVLNTDTNRVFSRSIEPAFVGFHGLWLDLAVEDVNKYNEDIIEKVQAFIRKILYSISTVTLRCVLNLGAKLSNNTGRSSTHSLLKRYCKL